MTIVLTIAYLIVFVYFLMLIARLIVDWVQVFARSWRPTGFVLLVVEAIYTISDPPLKLVRKLVPPVRMGSVQLDIGFFIVMIACTFLMSILGTLAG